MLRPRRPLLGAAMIGGAYAAGRGRVKTQYREQEQEERLAALESEPAGYPPPVPQPTAAPPPPAPTTAPPAAADTDVATRLTQLKALLDQGVLTPEEFNLAKQRVLAG